MRCMIGKITLVGLMLGGWSAQAATEVKGISAGEACAILDWAWSNGRLALQNGSVVNAAGDRQTLLVDKGSNISFSGADFTVSTGKAEDACEGLTWYGAAALSNYRSSMQQLTPAFSFTDWSVDPTASGYQLPVAAPESADAYYTSSRTEAVSTREVVLVAPVAVVASVQPETRVLTAAAPSVEPVVEETPVPASVAPPLPTLIETPLSPFRPGPIGSVP